MRFKLDYPPVACPRPKVTRFGTYYPKKYTEWKKRATNDLKHLEEANVLFCRFILKRPKAMKKTGDTTPHTKRPDLDNFIKAICDSLPFDDSRIHTIVAQKVYSSEKDTPGIEIMLLKGEIELFTGQNPPTQGKRAEECKNTYKI